MLIQFKKRWKLRNDNFLGDPNLLYVMNYCIQCFNLLLSLGGQFNIFGRFVFNFPTYLIFSLISTKLKLSFVLQFSWISKSIKKTVPIDICAIWRCYFKCLKKSSVFHVTRESLPESWYLWELWISYRVDFNKHGGVDFRKI